MSDALRVGGVVGLVAFLLATGAAFAGTVAPELDPGMSIGGLALLGATAAFVIERYRRRTK
jgi:hypothetical protein